MSFDIVITWVDWSNKNFIKKLIDAGGRSEGCESGDFIELKYLLRSLKKHKINYRKIHIVHSDNHPPPVYLKETERLSFVPHSALVTDSSHLPLIHRESIVAHLHRIPQLHQYYFYLQDDLFIMNKNVFSKIIELYDNKKIYTFRVNLKKKYNVKESGGLWHQSTVNSSRIINGREEGNMIIFEHAVQFFDKKIMQHLEKKYNKQFLATFSYQNQDKEKYKEKDIICATCIFSNYLIYKMGYNELPIPEYFYTEIHTNGYDKVTESQKADLVKKLDDSRNTYVLNAQGNGISDEYSDCPIVHDIFYSFLEKEFPNRTEFENFQIDKFNPLNCKIKNFKLLIILLIIIIIVVISF
tara:strand:+ start:137 stop:1198 length:1062 start_codon:yes stop_codon:yes gene_type:complete